MKVEVAKSMLPPVTIYLSGEEAQHLFSILNYSAKLTKDEIVSEKIRLAVEATSCLIWDELETAGFTVLRD